MLERLLRAGRLETEGHGVRLATHAVTLDAGQSDIRTRLLAVYQAAGMTPPSIREALEQEPVKWKTLVHLLLITGARRGEILGLKWDKVDFDNNQVYICNNILYSADVGIYEDTPKTERSKR